MADCTRNLERWSGNPQSPWYWKFRLLQAEALSAQPNEAAALRLVSNPLPSDSGLRQLEVRRLVDLATLRQNRRDEARELMRRAGEIVTDPEMQVRIHLVLGQVALRDRDIKTEEAEFRAAVEAAIRSGRAEWEALAINNLASCRKSQNRYEESIELGLQALALANRAGARRTAAFADGNLGSSYSYVGDFPKAFQHELAAIDAFRAMGMRPNLAIAEGELGLIYDRNDELGQAIPHYRTAYELGLSLNNRRDAARNAENLALALIKTKDWNAAAEWNQKASDLAIQINAKDMTPYLARNRAHIANGSGHTDEARRIAAELLRDPAAPADMRWAANELLGEIDSDAGRVAQARQEFAAALRTIDGTRSELLSAHYKITLLSRLISFYRDYVHVLAGQHDDAEALRVVESSRARVMAERLGKTPVAFAGHAGLERFARQSNVWLLSFWLAPRQSYAWLTGPDRTRRFDLPASGEIESLVTASRKVVEHSVVDPLTLPPDLWNRVMAPIAAAIPAGARVIVIPDGPLHRVNLETLVVPSPQPHYWIEDVEIAVAPSLGIAMSKAPAETPRGSVLLIGDPEYKGSGYEPLPAAATELRDVQQRLQPAVPAVYTGPKATPTVYRQSEPAQFQVIHFAAHAEANIESPLDSAVVLSRQGDVFKLYARDVIDIPIHARLVTLSACRSAGAREYAGEGLIGFAWAFLQAGARSVVAGLWDVSDSSTAPLMSNFYQGIAAGRDPVTSLRAAKLSLLRGGERFRKPFFWGPFQVYLGSAER